MAIEKVTDQGAGIKQTAVSELTRKEVRLLEAFRACSDDAQDGKLLLMEASADFYRKITPYPDLIKKNAEKNAAHSAALSDDDPGAWQVYLDKREVFAAAMKETLG